MQPSALQAQASSSPTPLLDRVAPLPPPAAPGAGARILAAGSLAAMLALAALWRATDPAFARPLMAWMSEHLTQKLTAHGTGAGLFFVVCSAGVPRPGHAAHLPPAP